MLRRDHQPAAYAVADHVRGGRRHSVRRFAGGEQPYGLTDRLARQRAPDEDPRVARAQRGVNDRQQVVPEVVVW
jgi:hypothetical protein